MIDNLGGVLAFATEAMLFLVALMILLGRGFHRYWASAALIAAVVMAAMLANAPLIFGIAVIVQLVFIISTTARLIWPRQPWEPR